MNYIPLVVSLLGGVGAIITILKHSLKPIETKIDLIQNDVADLRNEYRTSFADLREEHRTSFADLRKELQQIDHKYDKKTDEIRRDILMLSRDLHAVSTEQVRKYRHNPHPQSSAA